MYDDSLELIHSFSHYFHASYYFLFLLPAALSNGIGSETSKPLAIVVIGGLITATILTLLVFPLFFFIGYRKLGKKMD